MKQLTIKLDLINACNQRCSFCPYFGKRGSVVCGTRLEPLRKLNADFLLDQIRELKQEGIDLRIQISGRGEATLHPAFGRLLQGFREMSLSTRLITNGLLLDRFVNDLSDCEVIVSIHGKENTHDTIVGKPGAHKMAKRNISLFKPEAVTIAVVICKENMGELEDIIREWASYKLRISHNFIDHSEMDGKALWHLLQKLKGPNVRVMPDMDLDDTRKYYSSGLFIVNSHLCDYFDRAIDIHSDGKVTNCKEEQIGDLSTHNLSHILKGEKRSEFINKVKEELSIGLNDPLCNRCCYQTPSKI